MTRETFDDELKSLHYELIRMGSLVDMNLPYQIDTDMKKRLWGKFMLNVGVNQTVAVFEGDNGTIQKEGEARNTMIQAMREVMAISDREEIHLTQEDLNYWLRVLSVLSPEGKPSMRQDLEAKRRSEVGLFAGTVIEFGKKYGIPTPVNQSLYDKIKLLESRF
jgi:2-dehydropantoate 2-reductase